MNRFIALLLNPYFKGILAACWLLLFVGLLQRDYFVRAIDANQVAAIERDKRTEFQGIYFSDKKIGYAESHFLPEKENKLRVQQIASMRLNISGRSYPVDLNLDALLRSDNTLERFSFTFSSPLYQMAAEGRVDGNMVTFSLDTGNSVIEDTISLNGPPMLSTSRRSYLLTQGIKPGKKVRIPWFDPFSLTGKETVIQYRGKERTLIHNRVFNLHRFTEIFAGARLDSWLDDNGDVVKEESPAGFVFIKEPEFKAKALDNESPDLLASVSVRILGAMPDLSTKSVMRYRLKLPAEGDFDLDGGRQSFAGDILSVALENVPLFPSAVSTECPGGKEALLSSPYIQSAAPEIVDLSLKLTAEANNDYEKVKQLAGWVYRTIEKRPVIGIPDALTTLKTGIGDCNEHTSLFAALARAAGVPTKIAAGVVFHQGAFYYHAWNEVCLQGSWISLDSTTDQLPADLSHLRFIEGELQEQIRIGSLLNNLEIEPLPD